MTEKRNLRHQNSVFVRLSDEHKELLKKMCKNMDISIAHALRIIIKDFLDSGRRVKYTIE